MLSGDKSNLTLYRQIVSRLAKRLLQPLSLLVSVRLAVLAQNSNATDCRCPVRCRRDLYEPVLSNAQLSKLAFDRLFLQQPERKAELDRRYEKARETAQRVVVNLRASDQKLIDNLQSAIEVSCGSTVHFTELNVHL